MTTTWGDEDDSVDSNGTFDPLDNAYDVDVDSEVDELLEDVDWIAGNSIGVHEGDIFGTDGDSALNVARANSRISTENHGVVHIGQDSCPHSRYLTSTGLYHSTGYVGKQTYVLPLHVLPVVPVCF